MRLARAAPRNVRQISTAEFRRRTQWWKRRTPAAILALATLAGSGAASEAGALWMTVLDISVIAAMQAGYIGGSALFVAVAD